MGLIQAFSGAIGGTFAAQWKDFLTVPAGLRPTAAFFPAVSQGQNNGRGSNTKGPSNIVSNGSKIFVPEGYGLITTENGKITGVALESGGYVWESDDAQAASIFAGQFWEPFVAAWQQFTFGGQPGTQQLAFYVALKELPNNSFGTQSEIYFDDKFLNTQVGVVTRGSYSMKIVDPVTFVAKFLPATYLSAEAKAFDFTDGNSPLSMQLFREVVASLAPAFSRYANDPAKGRIALIQSDTIGFAEALDEAVEENFRWREDRGLSIEKVALVAVEYDKETRELIKTVQRADALSGGRGNSNLQASVAAGFEGAGQTEGAAGLIGLGMAGGAVGLSGLNQPVPSQAADGQSAPAQGSLAAQLSELKGLLDQGLITDADYEAAKSKALGL